MELENIRKKISDGVHYQFKGDITIYTVNKLKKILIDELSQNSKVELDLNHVDKFDSAGFQLFLYLEREAKKNNKQISIVQKSICISKIFNLFGMPV